MGHVHAQLINEGSECCQELPMGSGGVWLKRHSLRLLSRHLHHSTHLTINRTSRSVSQRVELNRNELLRLMQVIFGLLAVVFAYYHASVVGVPVGT